MTGTVKDKGKQKRTVVLEQKIASGWRKVDKVRSSRSGAYGITVPTDWFYSTKRPHPRRGDPQVPRRHLACPPDERRAGLRPARLPSRGTLGSTRATGSTRAAPSPTASTPPGPRPTRPR